MRSSEIDRLTWKSTSPSASTLAVCISDTMPPSRNASTGRPLVPTRYAPMRVLPWPGRKAWPAPMASATASIPSTTPTSRSCRVTRAVSESPDRLGGVPARGSGAAAAAGVVPATKVASTDRRSSGAWIRLSGYLRSSSLRSRSGAVDVRRSASPRATTTISRQPSRLRLVAVGEAERRRPGRPGRPAGGPRRSPRCAGCAVRPRPRAGRDRCGRRAARAAGRRP